MSRQDNAAWYLTIRQVEEQGMLVLSLAGRLSSGTSEQLLRALVEASDGRSDGVVLDLTDVDYVSSAGFRALEDGGARLHAAHRRLVVFGLGTAVRPAFAIAGPIPHVAIESSRDLALAYAREQ